MTHRRSKLILRTAFVLLFLLVLALSAPAHPARAQRSGEVPRFEPDECPFEIPYGERIECGYLVVPESRSDPDGPTIRLAVAILKSYSNNPAPDPVVYLEGGPGGSALDGVDFWAGTSFQEKRDFILVDQRGTGYSEPSLHCPEFDELYSDTLDDLLEDEEELRLYEEAARACHDRLVAEGINLAAYNSVESAADLADLRRVLGYEAWNLYGISYGTRLAQTIMREHPEGIRSVILDSTVALPAQAYEEGPDLAARAFGALFAGCAADPGCRTAFPDLEARFYEFVGRADEKPITVRITNPYNGKRIGMPLTGDDLLDTLFGALYDSSLIPFLPLMLNRAIQGDTRMLATYIELDLEYEAETDFSAGMYYSVECYEEVPFNDPAVATRASEAHPELSGFLVNDADFSVCPMWGVDEAPPLENEPVRSAIPTLVLAGEYDPITPPRWGQLAAETLANGTFYMFPGLGHGATISDCPERLAVAFVDNPNGKPRDICMKEMESPDFVTDLAPSPGIYGLLKALMIDSDAGQYFLIILPMLVFGSAVTVWPVLRLAHYFRRRPAKPSRWVQAAGWLAALVGGWNIVFLVALAVVVVTVAIEDETILVFGLPRWASPLLVMPYVSAALTLALLVLNVPVWRERYWKLFGRLYYGLIVLAALVFVWWMAMWRLLNWPF